MNQLKNELLLIGGGGHCVSCINTIESLVDWNIIGIIDCIDKIGKKVLGYPVIGSDDDLSSLNKKYSKALISIGQISHATTRKSLYQSLLSLGFVFPVFVDSSAHVSKHSTIGDGTILMHQSFVNARVAVGVNCIINTNSALEHDVLVGDHCHISTGAIINGNCVIGDECFIGSGTVVSNGISIVSNTIIGAGSLVRKDIAESGVYVGNPLRKIK